MIDENVKLETLYKNRKSNQMTYFFVKVNNKLFGVRKVENADWNFGTWSIYSNPANTDDEVRLPIEEKTKLQREALKYWFKAGIHNITI